VNRLPSTLVCSGCGTSVPPEEPYPFRCPRAGAGGDIDHVLVRVLDTHALAWPDDSAGRAQGAYSAGRAQGAYSTESNPFLRYRSLLRSHQLALAGGLSDDAYRELAVALDAAVAGVDGHGFRVTPFVRAGELSSRLGFDPGGGVWIKDETGNVSGSHKARHMMGLALHLDVVARLGLADSAPPLAIASCGNAALAAAVVAKAARRPLDVFVPVDAPTPVVARLKELGARITVCERKPGMAGDPTYHRLREAIAAGALPFTCQGNENGLVIEGGETLGWEIASAIGQAGGGRLDRVVVQVGGGALASAVAQALREAVELGALPKLPRVDTVQTGAAYPLKRACDRVAARLQNGEDLDAALHYAATHRSEFMWPWESAPHSVAHGILDDETYDWLAVVRGMLSSGGTPVVVDEAALEEANALAMSATGIDVDHTGSSGLAGLMALLKSGRVAPGERVAVLFTGATRH
jgi:threonine synthase